MIAVADPVEAAEAVVAKELAEAEGHGAAIKQRDVALVLVLTIEVEQARFQGLDVRAAAKLEFALENQAAVDAGTEDAALGVLGRAQNPVLQIIGGEAVARAWHQEGARTAPGQADE